MSMLWVVVQEVLFGRRLWLLVGVLSVQACAPSGPPVEPWGSGFSRGPMEAPPYKKLRAQESGWRIWEAASKEHVACVAIKPAEGTPWPELSFEQGGVVGSGGFHMFVLDSAAMPYFGFYGKYPLASNAVAEVGGTEVVDIDNLDTVLGWEGLRVPFKVSTSNTPDGVYRPYHSTAWTFELSELFQNDQPRSRQTPEGEQSRGVVDFTGVEDAYRVLMRCREIIAG